MLNSDMRMKYIIEYMTAYKEKINMANRNGLFDSAKMFELFAAEICSLWFGINFNNLNVETATYPYVDLISEDKKIFVQVSTVQDVPVKIKKTLEKIRDSKSEQITSIQKIIFFVLDNKSIENVKEYVGDNQIGNIPFTLKDNLITTQDIIDKAQNDLVFQEKLYEVLKKEFDNYNSNAQKLKEALDFSKNIGLKNIDSMINGEYEINRDEFLEKIRKDNYQFLSIQGRAGSGKSVLCKKYIENEELVLYARAERFIEENNLDAIWNCNIQSILECINGKRLFVFIDALEFIADCPKTKFELLQQLYDIACNYENVYIITSCRTSDKSAFFKLESTYSVKAYELDDITEEELSLLAQKYPIIRSLKEKNMYVELLKSPFYINLIVSQLDSIEDISDENSFREYIWSNVICLKKKSKRYGISCEKIIETIEKIVFERAKKFLLGIHKDDLDEDILHALLSEDVITEQGEYVRLKYDIFEDICFEHYFDKAFDACKGQYSLFYVGIESLGRCVFRRYQIWISNKLFLYNNREKFLYHLIFSDKIPQEWKQQTEIGITKSRYCDDFFLEQKDNLVETGLLYEFIKITNLYAFEARICEITGEIPYVRLQPCGNGRACIIRILEGSAAYRLNYIRRDDVIKLCSDYGKQSATNHLTLLAACTMLEYYVEESFAESKKDYYKIVENISSCLKVLYRMAEQSEEWLENFFEMVIDDYKCPIKGKRRAAEDIMKWTLKNVHPCLVKVFPNKMCQIAEELWLEKNTYETDKRYIESSRFSDACDYGLSENGEHYKRSYRNVYANEFLFMILSLNFKEGLEWILKFVNEMINEYASRNSQNITKIRLYMTEENPQREYLGNANLWLTGIEEQNVPTLLGDMIFCLKTVTIDKLDYYRKQEKSFNIFAGYVKHTIYERSNNVALLSVINGIGMHFEEELPGYALDLATSIEIIRWDTLRYLSYNKDPSIELLEKHIFKTLGVPNLKDRYDLDEKCNLTIQDYVSHAQIYFDSILENRCYQILDYLYTVVKNDAETANDYLQVQKMDLRHATKTMLNDHMVVLEPQITGEAAKLVKNNKKTNEYEIRLLEKITKCGEAISSGENDLDIIVETIDVVLNFMKASKLAFKYQKILISLIANALKKEELEKQKREMFCNIWLDGIQELFCNGSFLADTVHVSILLNQLNSDVNISIKNKIKKMILNCLMHEGDHGIIAEMTRYVKSFLSTNQQIAQLMFNTIIMLAEYEGKDKKGRECKDFIIETYLFNEQSVEIQEFDMSKYDIGIICHAVKCGLSFEHGFFKELVHQILVYVIDFRKANEENYGSTDVIDVYQEYDITELYMSEMVQANNDAKEVIDTLFDGIDFTKFTSDMIEFYQNIFGNFVCEFFNAYIDPQRRNRCKRKILYIESRINEISNEKVRVELYKVLIFAINSYCSGDWRSLKTEYTYADKVFLNEQFTKYGSYHIRDLLKTIYQLQMNNLLPEILISINNSFKIAKNNSLDTFRCNIEKENIIVKIIILKAFLMYSDTIKQDDELTEAYENILKVLIELNYEEAAVLLDEFRVH